MENKDLYIVWELCVEKDEIKVRTGTMMKLDYSIVCDLYEKRKVKDQTRKQFVEILIDSQMKTILEGLNEPEKASVDIYLENKEEG